MLLLQEVHHNQGVCYMYLKEMDKAKECLNLAITYQKHELSFVMLGKCYMMDNDVRRAAEIYKQAVE